MVASEDWVTRYGSTALTMASFAFIGAAVAWPLLRPLWSAQVTMAQLALGGARQELGRCRAEWSGL